MTLKTSWWNGEKFLRNLGARPSFKGLYGTLLLYFIKWSYYSWIPTDVVLKEGDILGIDIGSEIDGWYGDSAITMPIKFQRRWSFNCLCKKDSLYYAIDVIKEVWDLKELSKLIEDFITSRDINH